MARRRGANKTVAATSDSHPRNNSTRHYVPTDLSTKSNKPSNMDDTTSPLDWQRKGIFRLNDLPAELREIVYYHASAPFPPMDTAAITNTSNLVKVPAIAQLSRETRKEALAVFYWHREIRLSLHCARNIQRSVKWLEACGSNAYLSNVIGISGKLPPGEFFHITIHCSKHEPQFQVFIRPGATKFAEKRSQDLKDMVFRYLEAKALSKTNGQEGRLTAGEMHEILNLVDKMAAYE